MQQKEEVCVYLERRRAGGCVHISQYTQSTSSHAQETASVSDTEVPSEYYLENEGN